MYYFVLQREAAATVAALQAEKDAAIAAAAAAAIAASAPAEAMEIEDATTPEVKEECGTEASPDVSNESSDAKSVEATIDPAVIEETPMETEEMAPVSEAVKVDETVNEKHLHDAVIHPETDEVEIPVVVEAAPTVETIPIAETTSIVENVPVVEAIPAMEMVPVAIAVAEPDSVADTTLPVMSPAITEPSVDAPPVLQIAEPQISMASAVLEAVPEPIVATTVIESAPVSLEVHQPAEEHVPVSPSVPAITAETPFGAIPTVIATNELIPAVQPAPSEPVESMAAKDNTDVEQANVPELVQVLEETAATVNIAQEKGPTGVGQTTESQAQPINDA